MYCTFYAAIHLPLADVTAYGFTKAFFVVLFAALFLGERVYTRRVIPICCGFLGVLILLRPGFAMELAALVGLLAAVFMAPAGAGSQRTRQIPAGTRRPAIFRRRAERLKWPGGRVEKEESTFLCGSHWSGIDVAG